jgi:surface antigen
MRKLLVAGVVLACGWLAFSVATTAEDEKPKATIKEVMKACMKGGLCKKVADGKATEEEKKKLVEQFEALAANKPPKGDEASWKEKTAALLSAAKDCEAGKEGAGAALGKAANCMMCHSAHKGG